MNTIKGLAVCLFTLLICVTVAGAVGMYLDSTATLKGPQCATTRIIDDGKLVATRTVCISYDE